MRAVLDPNVLIAALFSPGGAPARTLVAWRAGRFELFASPGLLGELERALAYPKLRHRIPAADAGAFTALLARDATIAADIPDPPARASDSGDDYLIALAADRRAVLVTGDGALLALAGSYPVFTPAAFLGWLDAPRG